MSTTSSPPPTPTKRKASHEGTAATRLQAFKLHEERTAKRISQLEAIINDASLGVVSRTKAKVELALLKKEDDDPYHNVKKQMDNDEIAAIRGGVSKTKQMVEENIKRHEDRAAKESEIQSHLLDLHQAAVERRREARLKSEEARIRLAEVEAALRDAEKEYEDAMSKAREAMKKLQEARKRAGEERRLFKEAMNEEENLIGELERLEMEAKKEKEKGNNMDEMGEKDGVDGDAKMGGTSDDDEASKSTSKVGPSHGDFLEFISVHTGDSESVGLSTAFDDEVAAMKADLEGAEKKKEEDAAKFADLNDEMANLKAMIEELRATNESQEGKIRELEDDLEKKGESVIVLQATNESLVGKNKSLEDHIEKSGDKEVYWKEQSEKLSGELEDMQQQRKEQEEEILELKRKVTNEDMQIDDLKVEVQDLREMKELLESKLLTAEEKEKAKLQKLRDEVTTLLSEKEQAVEAAESVKAIYEKTIKEREEKIYELEKGVDIRNDELQQKKAVLDDKDAVVSDLRSQIEQLQREKEQEKEEWSKVQEWRMKKLTADLGSTQDQVASLENVTKDQRSAINQVSSIQQMHTDLVRVEQVATQGKEENTKLTAELERYKQLVADLELSIERLEGEMAQEKENLTQAQTEEANKYIAELELLRNKVVELEKINEDQRVVVMQGKDENEKLTSDLERYKEQVAQLEKNNEDHLVVASQGKDENDQLKASLAEKAALAAALQLSIEQLQVEKAQEKEHLTKAQKDKVAQLEQRHKEQIADLEQINEDQRVAVEKMKKLVSKKNNMKEAFMVQDREIQRLSESLAIETDKGEKLSAELEHWKDSATDLSKSVYALQEKANMEQLANSSPAEFTKRLDSIQAANVAREGNQENEKLTSELRKYQDRVAKLESVNENQNVTIESLKLRQSSTMDVDETPGATLPGVKDNREIQMLEALVAEEKEKAERASMEAAHYKDTAEDMSQTVCVMDQTLDEMKEEMESMQSKLEGRGDKMENAKEAHLEEINKLKMTIIKQMEMIETLKKKSGEDDFNSSGDDLLSFGDRTEGTSDAKQDNSAMAEILSRVLADRDRLSYENNELKDALVKKGESIEEALKMTKEIFSEKEAKEEEVIALKKKLQEIAAEKERLQQSMSLMMVPGTPVNERVRRESLAKVKALEAEKEELSKRLNILIEEGTVIKPKPNHGKTQVYQLSCRDCNEDLHYIGKTKRDLKVQVKDHFDEVWNIIQREKAAKDGEAVDDKKKKGEGGDFGKSDFAKHFARHCKRAQTYEEVLTWCAANIKVKKQKLKDEGGASDNKQTERTVYQLTCKDCKSNLHYIGSTHQELKEKVREHYNDVWQIVQNEYFDGGFCEDAESGAHLGKFGSSGSHFAKHCRQAKSQKDVNAWCKKHVKVEKWIMVCRTCLGTAVDTNQYKRDNYSMATERASMGTCPPTPGSIMSFKVEA